MNPQAQTKSDNGGVSFRRQSIAVVGSDPVAVYYGACLWQAGHDVKFVVEDGDSSYANARDDGIRVDSSIIGDLRIGGEHVIVGQVDSKTSTLTTSLDWIIVAVKSASIQTMPHLIHPLLALGTRILVLTNGHIDDDCLVALLGAGYDQVGKNNIEDNDDTVHGRTLYGGIPFITCHHTPNGLKHSFGNRLSAGVIATRGSRLANTNHAEARVHLDDRNAFVVLWEETRVEAVFEAPLLRARWAKTLMDFPIDGLSVAMGGIAVESIAIDHSLRQLAEMMMDEIIEVANRDLERRYGKGGFGPLNESDKAESMSSVDDMGTHKTSMVLNFLQRRPMEVKCVFRKPLERAFSLGISAPCLETLVLQIEAIQRLHDLF